MVRTSLREYNGENKRTWLYDKEEHINAFMHNNWTKELADEIPMYDDVTTLVREK